MGDVRLEEIESERPRVLFEHEGTQHVLECDVVAGCDGFHGVCRPTIPAGVLRTFSREYPFGWLGILAAVAPSNDELVYAHHERGFALLSLRSPELSRLYLQCRPDEDIDDWPDERIWEELQVRLGLPGWTLAEGPMLEKGITPMRSFVAEPMRHGRLFLAGDAAHIVPPTGAKGLNLAVHDVRLLADALAEWYAHREPAALLDSYSTDCLRRVWRAEHFSWWMTTMLHRPEGGDPFDLRLQESQLRYVTTSHGGGDVARRELRRARRGLTGRTRIARRHHHSYVGPRRGGCGASSPPPCVPSRPRRSRPPAPAVESPSSRKIGRRVTARHKHGVPEEQACSGA